MSVCNSRKASAEAKDLNIEKLRDVNNDGHTFQPKSFELQCAAGLCTEVF